MRKTFFAWGGEEFFHKKLNIVVLGGKTAIVISNMVVNIQ